MRKYMYKALHISGLCMLVISFFACSKDDGDKLEGKWQMRQTIHSEEGIEPVDSVFYNFMNGTFSALCMKEDGGYGTYFGIYTVTDGMIRVRLTDDDAGKLHDRQHTSVRYMHWSGTTKEFTIATLTGSSLQLVSDEYSFVFRKY